jgi:hypothetical protein
MEGMEDRDRGRDRGKDRDSILTRIHITALDRQWDPQIIYPLLRISVNSEDNGVQRDIK